MYIIDIEKVLTHHIQHENYKSALDVLSKQVTDEKFEMMWMIIEIGRIVEIGRNFPDDSFMLLTNISHSIFFISLKCSAITYMIRNILHSHETDILQN